MAHYLTSETDYFRPLDSNRIKDCILDVSLHTTENTERFHLEIYTEYKHIQNESNGAIELTYRRVPHPSLSTIEACQFSNRFSHSYHKIAPNNGPNTALSFNSSICWITAKLIEIYANACNKDNNAQLRFSSALAKEKYNALIADDTIANRNAHRVHDYKERAANKDHSTIFNIDTSLPLKPFQTIAAFNSITTNKYFFGFKPGCGKTAAAIGKLITVARTTKSHSSRPARILILAPKQIIDNWDTELDRFIGDKLNYHVSKIEGQSNTRLRTLLKGIAHSEAENEANIILANYECVENTPFLLNVEWDLCIVDESQNIANPSAKRTKAILSLRDKCRHRICLSGTPIRNFVWDYRTQFEFLEKGLSGFPDSHEECKQFFGQFAQKQPGRHVQVLEGYQNLPILKELFAKHGMFVTKKEALPELPEKRHSTISVRMTAEQCQAYDSVCENLCAYLDNAKANGEPDAMILQNAMNKSLRLSQITSGFLPTESSGIFRFDPNPKMDELVSFLSEQTTSEDKVVIWCAFRESVRHIAAALRLADIPAVTIQGGQDNTPNINAFNGDPNIKAAIATIDIGVGMNLVGYDFWNATPKLETNTTYAIYFSRSWKSNAYEQSEDRIHRANTRVSPQIISMLVPGSIDEEMKDRVDAKINMGNMVADLKDMLKRIRSFVR